MTRSSPQPPFLPVLRKKEKAVSVKSGALSGYFRKSA